MMLLMRMRLNEFGNVILFSLLLTLFVIPAMYSFLSSKRGKDEAIREKRQNGH
jgi:hypothetical protein